LWGIGEDTSTPVGVKIAASWQGVHYRGTMRRRGEDPRPARGLRRPI